MKKLHTFITLFGLATLGYGQGLISWANTASTLISVQYFPLAPVVMPVRDSSPNTFYFGLFIAPLGTPAPSSYFDLNWQNVVSYTTNSTAAAGSGRMQNPGTAVVPGYAPGTTVNFIIRGWHSGGGTDWGTAGLSTFFLGQSLMGSAILGGGAFPTPSAFGVANNQIPGFVIYIPEPSSLALFGLGAAACIFVRRCNQQSQP